METRQTVYDSVKALNWSSLKYMAKSPLEYRYRIDHPEPRKTAWIVGGAIHCLTLEPDKFDSRYAVFEGTRRGAKWDDWQALHPGIESLKPAEKARVVATAGAIHAHPVASKLLAGCRVEEPLEWTDPDTGMKCKGRVDAIDPACVVDLKSARDVDPFRFNRAASNYLYHGQLSLYQTGAIALRKISGKEMPYIIAAQSAAPFDVAVYRMKPDDLDAGRALCLSLMRKLEECIASDWFPGVAPDLQYLDLPPWTPGLGGVEEESEGF